MVGSSFQPLFKSEKSCGCMEGKKKTSPLFLRSVLPHLGFELILKFVFFFVMHWKATEISQICVYHCKATEISPGLSLALQSYRDFTNLCFLMLPFFTVVVHGYCYGPVWNLEFSIKQYNFSQFSMGILCYKQALKGSIYKWIPDVGLAASIIFTLCSLHTSIKRSNN